MLKKMDVGAAYWCVVSGSNIWMPNGELPLGVASDFNLPAEKAIQVATHGSIPVMWLNDADIDDTLEMRSLRDFLHLEESLFLTISRVVQYGHMSQTLRFCAQCGGRTGLNHRELAMQCGECRTLYYPRIFPCVIVAVRHQDRILLAQHAHHTDGMYTVIAGFVEVGETLEQCVAREVLEETGITVKNIRYFGSQPWAFPSSMMVGFIADYESGTVKADDNELNDANWFSMDNTPLLPPQGTIARALIEHTFKKINENR